MTVFMRKSKVRSGEWQKKADKLAKTVSCVQREEKDKIIIFNQAVS